MRQVNYGLASFVGVRVLCVGLASLLLASVAASPAGADPIVAGATALPGRAIQDVTLLANTPFNPTGSDIVIDDLFGDGTIFINRDTQVGSTIAIPTLA